MLIHSFIYPAFLQRVIGLSQKKKITFLFHCFSFSFRKIRTVERESCFLILHLQMLQVMDAPENSNHQLTV